MQKQKRQSKRMADDNVLALEATCERQLLGVALSLKIAQITKLMQAWKKRKQSDVGMIEKGRQQKRLKKAKRHRVKSECLKERESNKMQRDKRQNISIEAREERKQKQYKRNLAVRSKESKEEETLRLSR